jgi:hypothetical protein
MYLPSLILSLSLSFSSRPLTTPSTSADQLHDVTKLNAKASAQLKKASSSASSPYDAGGEDGSDSWWSEHKGGLSGHFGKAFCVVVSQH